MSAHIYEETHTQEARSYRDVKKWLLYSLLIILSVFIALGMDRKLVKLWEFQDLQIHLSFLVIRKNYSLPIIAHSVYGVFLMAIF